MNSWRNPENWNNSSVSYNKETDILYFNSTAEYEAAGYTVPVPEGASSFSLSFKAGNSRSITKTGAQDTGYITVSTEKGIISRTAMINNNTEYAVYSLGTAESPVPVQCEQLFITAEAYNSYNNSIDFYFGGFNIEFYETLPDEIFTEYYFCSEKTEEKVQDINGKPPFSRLSALPCWA